jgi:hypothetical protein
MKRSVDNKEISTKLRKDKLNIINLKESNLTSTISDSKQKEKNNKLLKPKTATFRKIENIKLKGNQIKKIKLENDNNIKFLKNNLKKLNTEGDIIENKKTNTIEIKENNINNIKNNRNDLTLKDKNQNRNKETTNINNINSDSYINNKNIENKCIRIIRQRILSYKKDKTKSYSNNTCANIKNNISSFDKRKKYIVPIIKHKKNKKKTENKKVEKKKDIEKGKKIIENKEILTSNLIKNKQIEYLRDYQKYMDEFNNKLYKDNEKKFRFIQQEGFDLDNLFLDDDNDENMNDTIDEIYEKEEAEGEGDENQESI